MPNKVQKTLFMFRKLKKDITRDRVIYQLADNIDSPNLNEYYFIMTEEMMLAGHSQEYHFDESGIPIIPSYVDVDEKRMIYYPISIGQYGLAIWNTYLRTNSESDKKRFLNIVEWFYRNRIDDDKLGVYWLTDVDKPAYQILKPWKSAFSQARGINILLRGYQLTENESYLEVAEKALYPFQYSVRDGGIATLTDAGPFYEEYPSREVPVLVLNGMIFSLCGIYDFLRVYRDHEIANEIFKKGVTTLAKILPRFDMGFWSKYSLCEASFHPKVDPASIGYHHLHIVQMELMYRITKLDIFKEYASRWQQYVKMWNIIKMYGLKYKALKKMNRL